MKGKRRRPAGRGQVGRRGWERTHRRWSELDVGASSSLAARGGLGRRVLEPGLEAAQIRWSFFLACSWWRPEVEGCLNRRSGEPPLRARDGEPLRTMISHRRKLPYSAYTISLGIHLAAHLFSTGVISSSIQICDPCVLRALLGPVPTLTSGGSFNILNGFDSFCLSLNAINGYNLNFKLH